MKIQQPDDEWEDSVTVIPNISEATLPKRDSELWAAWEGCAEAIGYINRIELWKKFETWRDSNEI